MHIQLRQSGFPLRNIKI